MLVLVGHVGENDSVGDILTRPLSSSFLEMLFAGRREAKEPKNRIRMLLENGQPETENEGIDLKNVRVSKGAPSCPEI